MTHKEIFESAMKCKDKAEAAVWLDAEVARWQKAGVEPDKARATILSNLGYIAGYYSPDTARKVQELFGAAHPIFGPDYFKSWPSS